MLYGSLSPTSNLPDMCFFGGRIGKPHPLRKSVTSNATSPTPRRMIALVTLSVRPIWAILGTSSSRSFSTLSYFLPPLSKAQCNQCNFSNAESSRVPKKNKKKLNQTHGNSIHLHTHSFKHQKSWEQH